MARAGADAARAGADEARAGADAEAGAEALVVCVEPAAEPEALRAGRVLAREPRTRLEPWLELAVAALLVDACVLATALCAAAVKVGTVPAL